MAGLEFEMTYRLKVGGPLDSTKGSPLGERQYWEMTEATLVGADALAAIAVFRVSDAQALNDLHR
jgi:hypothetical protein